MQKSEKYMHYQEPGKREFSFSQYEKINLVVFVFFKKNDEEDSVKNDKPFFKPDH